MVKVRATVAMYVLMSLVAVGCSDDGQAAKPSAQSSSPTTMAPSTSSPPTEAAWRAKFTEAQLEVYEEALGRWQEYTEKANDIYRAGEDTPEARAVLREYDMQWQGQAKILATSYAKGGVRTVTPPKSVSWRALSIKPKVVLISQCTDYTNVLVTKNGKPLAGTKPKHLVTPLVIEMDKPSHHNWMVARTELRDNKSCAP